MTHEDTHVTLWKGLGSEVLRLPNNCLHQLASHVSESS